MYPSCCQSNTQNVHREAGASAFKLSRSRQSHMHGCMDLSKLLHRFVEIDTWIVTQMLLHGFVKVGPWICQKLFYVFWPVAKQNQAEL